MPNGEDTEMRAEKMRQRPGPSTPGVGGIEEDRIGDARVDRERGAAADRSGTLRPELQALFDESFQRNELGFRYLVNR